MFWSFDIVLGLAYLVLAIHKEVLALSRVLENTTE